MPDCFGPVPRPKKGKKCGRAAPGGLGVHKRHQEMCPYDLAICNMLGLQGEASALFVSSYSLFDLQI